MNRADDVLWMGKYGSSRRLKILRTVWKQLENAGAYVHFADNEENPFVFGRDRTELLNRTKIVVNVTRT